MPLFRAAVPIRDSRWRRWTTGVGRRAPAERPLPAKASLTPLLTLTATISHNDQTGQPVKRSLTAYDH